MIEVKLDEGDRLVGPQGVQKKVLKSGILKELRRKRHYVKPSEARQLKSAAARRRARQNRDPPSKNLTGTDGPPRRHSLRGNLVLPGT
jgi:small subunit ribosomal protein S21